MESRSVKFAKFFMPFSPARFLFVPPNLPLGQMSSPVPEILESELCAFPITLQEHNVEEGTQFNLTEVSAFIFIFLV